MVEEKSFRRGNRNETVMELRALVLTGEGNAVHSLSIGKPVQSEMSGCEKHSYSLLSGTKQLSFSGVRVPGIISQGGSKFLVNFLPLSP